MVAAPPMSVVYGVIVVILAGLGGLMYAASSRASDSVEDELDAVEATTSGPGADVVDLDPPDIKSSRFGLAGELYALYKQHVKRKKMAARGYVQWYLIDGTYPRPKYVKPEMDGTGIQSVEHGDATYLMPKEAMVPSEQQGLWTVVHHVDDATPLNLHEPDELAIRPDRLNEYQTMQVTKDPPSWLSSLDIEPEQLLMYVLVGIIAYSFISGAI